MEYQQGFTQKDIEYKEALEDASKKKNITGNS